MALEPGSDIKFKAPVSDSVEKTLQSLACELHRGHLLLGLDRDGTLVPIADRPEEAKMAPPVAELVHELAARPDITVAIVSARSNAMLQADLPYQNIIFAGNYGVEIRFPDRTEIVQELALASIPHLHKVRNKLGEFTRPGINAILEDHGFSLCLHWHTVPVEERQQLHDTMEELHDRHHELLFRKLPTSYEVLPQMEWNKGQALQTITSHINGVDEKLKSFIYIGDSDADEAAFAWVNAKQGISVKVASAGGSTASNFQISDTTEVLQLLSGLRDLPIGGSTDCQ